MSGKAIVLLSGGMDSLVVMAHANEFHDEIITLHLTYGQNTAKKEKECFEKICDFYNVDKKHREIIDISFLAKIGGSSLTDENINVSQFAGDSDEIPSSYVPFRNTHILSMAVSLAEVKGAENIYIGANYEDSPGYPDCRPEYYEAFNNLISKGTKEGNITVHTPIIMDKKEDIIKKAKLLNAPLELSWSCYKSNDLACGVCDSCALRLRGFKNAGYDDPINYQGDKK
jgi:7-cyano-7-deazaguanine synthase